MNEQNDEGVMHSDDSGSGNDEDKEESECDVSVAANEDDIDIHRNHPIRFYVDYQWPYFILKMTLSIALETREFITWYPISKGCIWNIWKMR